MRDLLPNVFPNRVPDGLPAALPSPPRPDVVDDEATKNLRRVREEAATVERALTFARCNLEIRLVQQRGGAECDVTTRLPQLSRGQLVKLVVERREKRACGDRVTPVCGVEQIADAIHWLPAGPAMQQLRPVRLFAKCTSPDQCSNGGIGSYFPSLRIEANRSFA